MKFTTVHFLLGASLGVGVWFRLEAQAAAKVGRPGISTGRQAPPRINVVGLEDWDFWLERIFLMILA